MHSIMSSIGMMLYDMSMLEFCEVLKREDPSLSLRCIINAIEMASKTKVCLFLYNLLYVRMNHIISTHMRISRKVM